MSNNNEVFKFCLSFFFKFLYLFGFFAISTAISIYSEGVSAINSFKFNAERILAPTLLTKEFPICVNTGTPILSESLVVTPPLHGKVSKERSINLNLAVTYSEMNQIEKAKELLQKIKLDQLEEDEKDTFQNISQKIK